MKHTNKLSVWLLAASLSTSFAGAAVISASGSGGAIPEATVNHTAPGVINSDIIIASGGIVTGNLTVTINGLTHTWMGDLSATLTHVESGLFQDLFWRVGAATTTAFGDSSDPSGDFSFNNSFTGDLWAQAAAATGTTPIPGGDYFATSALSGSAVDLSEFFNGTTAAGTWRLTIQDWALGDSGSFTGWDLSFNAASEIPEPSFALPILAIGLIGVAGRSWRNRRANR